MKEICLITSNRGKVLSLQKALDFFGIEVNVNVQNLELTEPQFDTVKDVSAYKAKEAYARLKRPVLVEDGGFAVEALNGFPGVHTKFVLNTIGAAGILKLLAGESNRRARFISCASYIDEDGRLFQFERPVEEGEVEIADRMHVVDSPYAWSELWKIAYLPTFGKMMCDLSSEEVNALYRTGKGSLWVFARWYAGQK